MAQTDKQTDTKQRSSRWAFTAYEEQWSLIDAMKGKIEGHPIIRMMKWQTEKCKDTGRLHYQGAIQTVQCRWSALHKIFPGVHIERAREWFKLLNYVKKDDTAIPGTRVSLANEEVQEFYSMDDKMVMLGDAVRSLTADEAEQLIRYKIEDGTQDAEFWWFVTNKVLPLYGAKVAGAFADQAVRTFWRNTQAFWIRQDPER